MTTLEIPTHKICTKCKNLTDMNLFVKNKVGAIHVVQNITKKTNQDFSI